MEPTDALIQAELALRNLIRTVLGTTWQDAPGLPDAQTIDNRRRGEANSRQGVLISQDPMDYLYIADLKKIFDQRRTAFGDVFADKSRFNELVRILVAYRNTPFHARSLTWFESDLVSGASGWIVANISHWRNTREDREGDYPEILTVTDDTGQALRVGYLGSYNYPDLGSLDLGQTVTLTCRGVDADERTLVWRLYNHQPYDPDEIPLDEARGNSVKLTWTPSTEAVAPRVDVCVTLSAEDEYPRLYSSCDAIAAGYYAVLRPRTLKPRPSVL